MAPPCPKPEPHSTTGHGIPAKSGPGALLREPPNHNRTCYHEFQGCKEGHRWIRTQMLHLIIPDIDATGTSSDICHGENVGVTQIDVGNK
jgi:hypothetical protein